MEYSQDEIRLAIREALQDALPQVTQPVAAANAPQCDLMRQILKVLNGNSKSPVSVDVDSDAKFNQFIGDLALCMQDRNVIGLIRSNRLKFRMAGRSNSGGKTPNDRSAGHSDHRSSEISEPGNGHIASGVLTEAKILAIAKTCQKITVGSNVILTPLAKDRARAAGLQIVRQ